MFIIPSEEKKKGCLKKIQRVEENHTEYYLFMEDACFFIAGEEIRLQFFLNEEVMIYTCNRGRILFLTLESPDFNNINWSTNIGMFYVEEIDSKKALKYLVVEEL